MYGEEVKKQIEAFHKGDRVKRTFDGKTGTVDRWVFNHFYQVVWEVKFDDGTYSAVTTTQLELVKD